MIHYSSGRVADPEEFYQRIGRVLTNISLLIEQGVIPKDDIESARESIITVVEKIHPFVTAWILAETLDKLTRIILEKVSMMDEGVGWD